MLHEEYPPPEALRESIKCFWHNRRDFGEQPGSFEVMPDGYAEIIFSFGSVMRDGVALPSPFLMGLLNQPVVFSAAGRLEIIGIRCYPWTVFDLLGLAPGKRGVHTLEHPVAQLQPLLARHVQAGDIDAALGVLRRYFQPKQADSMLAKAGEAMRSAGGAMPVSEVAAAAHATVRTLERKFKQSSGHTVKDVSGLMRFEQARNRLWHAPQTNLAALAQELGYTDQSHLSREFKRYSGVAPSAFARKARAEAASEDFVAFVQAPAGARP